MLCVCGVCVWGAHVHIHNNRFCWPVSECRIFTSGASTAEIICNKCSSYLWYTQTRRHTICTINKSSIVEYIVTSFIVSNMYRFFSVTFTSKWVNVVTHNEREGACQSRSVHSQSSLSSSSQQTSPSLLNDISPFWQQFSTRFMWIDRIIITIKQQKQT